MEELTTINATEITNKELKDYTMKLKNCGDNIRKNYIKISFLLNEIEQTECYLDDGFESTTDYASKVLNIQKTTTYNLLKIGKDFISEKGDRTVLTDKGNDYGVSQLQALLPIGVEKAKELHNEGVISPDMSVRQIKQAIKQDEPEPEEDNDDNDEVIDGEGEEVDEEHIRIVADIQILEDGTTLINGDESDELNNLYLEIRKLVNAYFE